MPLGCRICRRKRTFIDSLALVFIGTVLGYFAAAVLLSRAWLLR